MIGESNNYLGYLLLLCGEYDQVVYYLKIVVGFFELIDDWIGFVKVNGYLGNLYFCLGEYLVVKECFQKSIKVGYVVGVISGSV